MNVAAQAGSLRSSLRYEPRELEFGTSGRRGKVVDLTQLEVYINALAELQYLQSIDASEGGIVRGQEFFFARDLRPGSDGFVPEFEGRGEIAQAIVAALRDAGMRPINLGAIPTPALTCYALACGKGSIMVTGSHIPFDRHGYKTNTSKGELLKQQEAPIHEQVRKVRQSLYDQRRDQSPFDEHGFFKTGHQDLPTEQHEARAAWIGRFTSFFTGTSLEGKRLLVYQHSAVGRDLLVEVLQRMGAEVIAAGRSDTFVPIDTENIGGPQLAAIQALADEATAKHGSLDAIVSTDGDSDRPLVVSVDPATAKAHFFGTGMFARRQRRPTATSRAGRRRSPRPELVRRQPDGRERRPRHRRERQERLVGLPPGPEYARLRHGGGHGGVYTVAHQRAVATSA